MTQKEALDILKLGYNVYLTGAAGTGKTYVLQNYIDFLKHKGVRVAVTASTGLAASTLGGMTIHSWAGIGINTTLSKHDISQLQRRRYLKRHILPTKVLIIDEASMLSAQVLDLVNQVCKKFRRNDRPFGGMQVVLCGDLFQLPPVVVQTKEIRLVHDSESWQEMNIRICYLEDGFRQDDEEYLGILNEIREQNISRASIKTLAHQLYKPLPVSTKLYTHMTNVNVINQSALAILPGDTHTFQMESYGFPPLVDSLKEGCIAPQILHLKKGAMVMTLKNNFTKGYVNGSLGSVIEFTGKGYPVVELLDGKRVSITPAEWVTEESGVVVARVKQLPLSLAWALTIHKSQGLSLDAASIDLGHPFLPGMGYVALSRVRNLKGLSLLGLNHKALEVDPRITLVDYELKERSEKLRRELKKIEWLKKQQLQSQFLLGLRK